MKQCESRERAIVRPVPLPISLSRVPCVDAGRFVSYSFLRRIEERINHSRATLNFHFILYFDKPIILSLNFLEVFVSLSLCVRECECVLCGVFFSFFVHLTVYMTRCSASHSHVHSKKQRKDHRSHWAILCSLSTVNNKTFKLIQLTR